jgi:hypothetical protein
VNLLVERRGYACNCNRAGRACGFRFHRKAGALRKVDCAWRPRLII